MFITFEGIEGSGKSTVLVRVKDYLQDRGHSVVSTLEPGGSELGNKLRSILLDIKNQDITNHSELFLYLADRAQHVASVINPALQAGKIVLSDRYADSTLVYQGYGRGLDLKKLNILNEMAVNGLWPKLTLLFDLPAEVGLKRAITRNMKENKANTEGRFEAESLSFHSKIREGYLTLAAINQDRFHIINAGQTPDKVLEDTLIVLEQKLNPEESFDAGI